MSDLIVRKRNFLADWNVVSKRCVTDPECCSNVFSVCDCDPATQTGCSEVCELTPTGHLQLYSWVPSPPPTAFVPGPPVGPSIAMVYGGGWAFPTGVVGHHYIVEGVASADYLVFEAPNAPEIRSLRLQQIPSLGLPSDQYVEIRVIIPCTPSNHIGSPLRGTALIDRYVKSNSPLGVLYTKIASLSTGNMFFWNPARCLPNLYPNLPLFGSSDFLPFGYIPPSYYGEFTGP